MQYTLSVRLSVCFMPVLFTETPTHQCADVLFNWRRPAATTGSQQ